jgi:hypothetical protein
MARQKSSKGKGSYAEYKSDNRVFKNKVRKLERHCKSFPNDKLSQENLDKLKEKGYTGRTRPLVPGSNPTEPSVNTVRGIIQIGHVFGPKTAGEQLSELLGIPMPKPKVYKRNTKPKITHKPRRK